MKKLIITSIIVLALLFLGYMFSIYFGNGEKPTPPTEGQAKIYRNQTYGIKFSYPNNYLLTEKEVGNAERFHYIIELIEDTPENQAILNGTAIDRDGPTTISFNIYENSIDKQPVINWMRNSASSNFKLGNQKYGTTTMSGAFAFTYTWSGLYEGKTIALAHKENIIAISATYLSPKDQILKDFASILSTIKLNK